MPKGEQIWKRGHCLSGLQSGSILGVKEVEGLNELLEELNIFFNMFSDPRYRGAHPKCDEIHDEMINILKDMEDTELETFLGGLTEDQLYMINYPLEEIQDDHPCVEKYKQF